MVPALVTATHSAGPKDLRVVSRTFNRAAPRRVGPRGACACSITRPEHARVDASADLRPGRHAVDTVYAHVFAWQRALAEACRSTAGDPSPDWHEWWPVRRAVGPD